MITTILFDLDGTLLPMDQEVFVNSYLKLIAARMAPHGYDPKLLVKAIWQGTGAMIQNDGSASNETVFWNVFASIFGEKARKDQPLFEEFYHTDFQLVQEDCGFDPRSAQAIREIRDLGYRTALATNPLFPPIATLSRIRWAGLAADDFELITTYDNSFHCKPSLAYYEDVMSLLKVAPNQCIMVGNDVSEDMIAEKLGMKVFLLTDCMINKQDLDISQYPHGSFPELMEFIRRLQ